MKRILLLLLLGLNVVATPLPSARVAHPVLRHPEEQLNLDSIPGNTAKRLEKEFRRAAAQPLPELLAEVATAAASIRYVNQRAGHYEELINLFAYACRDGEQGDYAERALRMMEIIARKTAGCREFSLEFTNSGRTISPCVYAYDLLYDSPTWAKLAPDAREVIENWFARTSYVLLRRLAETTEIHNMMPHAIQSGSGTALVLQSPELIREWIRFADRFLSRNMFMEDGMYCDFSTSYQLQVTNHLRWALYNFEQFRDLPGYTEITDGVKLDGTPDFFRRRWPPYDRAMSAIGQLRYPDGRLLPLGDTHCSPQPGRDERPVARENNLELNVFGLFSLRHGKGSGLREVYLAFPPVVFGGPYCGGHQHMDSLSLQLWGENSDQLPDAGYAAYRDGFSSWHKYFFHSARYHNTAMVWDRRVEPYSLQARRRSRARLLAYEDGSGSDHRLQLVEAAAPGPDFNGVRERRRMVVQIPSGADDGYTVDFFFLAGGEIHESYLLQSENEACELKLSVTPHLHPGTLRDLLGDRGGKDYNVYLNFFRDVVSVDGRQPLAGEFAGAASGVRTRFFLNPQPGGSNYFTTAPSLRRYKFQTEKEKSRRAFGEIRGHHLTRHVPASSGATIFGAVYEIVGPDAGPEISGVDWFRNGETIAAVIRTRRGCDIVYSSPDQEVRQVEGVAFSGRFAVLHLEPDGTPGWGYVRGNGRIQADGLDVQGAVSMRLVSALPPVDPRRRPDTAYAARELFPAELYVQSPPGMLPPLAGCWIYTELGDGSGFGAEVRRQEALGNLIRLELESPLPLRPGTGNRMWWIHLPGISETVQGAMRVWIDMPVFKSRH